MSIPMIISEIISDLIMLIASLVAVDIVEIDLPKIKPFNVVGVGISISVIGFASYTISPETHMIWLLMFLINSSKFCIAAMIIYRQLTVKKVWIVLIVQFICELINSGVQFLVSVDAKSQMNLSILLSRLVMLVVLLVIKRHSQNTYVKNIFLMVPNRIYFIIFVSCFFASGLIFIADFKATDSKMQTIKVFAIVVVLCLIYVFVSLITNVIAKKYYSDLNNILEQQVQAQISHYEQREKANTELRKFKHDYNNHINCIQALISSGRYEEVSEYLNKLSTLLPSDSFLYKTGNYLSDAILTDKQEKAKKDKIQISFSGTIPTSINNTDLCIILSNALDNAIESSRMCEGEKEISVYGGYRHGYFILVMKNPTVNNISDNAALPTTTKEDKLHHGFGLLNINTVVEKYNGFMKTEFKDDQFVLSLTFNSVTSIAD